MLRLKQCVAKSNNQRHGRTLGDARSVIADCRRSASLYAAMRPARASRAISIASNSMKTATQCVIRTEQRSFGGFRRRL